MGRVGGVTFLKINGEQFAVKNSATYNLGRPKQSMVVGHDGVHGDKSMPQVPYIEVALTDSASLDLAKLVTLRGATITLELYNGKGIVLRDAIYAGEGNVTTEEGEISARFEGMSADEL